MEIQILPYELQKYIFDYVSDYNLPFDKIEFNDYHKTHNIYKYDYYKCKLTSYDNVGDKISSIEDNNEEVIFCNNFQFIITPRWRMPFYSNLTDMKTDIKNKISQNDLNYICKIMNVNNNVNTMKRKTLIRLNHLYTLKFH